MCAGDFWNQCNLSGTNIEKRTNLQVLIGFSRNVFTSGTSVLFREKEQQNFWCHYFHHEWTLFRWEWPVHSRTSVFPLVSSNWIAGNSGWRMSSIREPTIHNDADNSSCSPTEKLTLFRRKCIYMSWCPNEESFGVCSRSCCCTVGISTLSKPSCHLSLRHVHL